MRPDVLTADQLANLMASDRPHAVLDLRERGSYERGHIFRATSLPRRLLEFRLPILVTACRTPIVLYDGDGTLTELARAMVEAMGYTDVRALRGGLAGWREAGRPVVEGVNVPSKVFGERVFHEMKTPQISAPDLRRRMTDGTDLVIVDVRTPEEYTRGCIPGAWSVTGAELTLRIGEVVERPDTTIVIHCGGRTRSYIGTESLRRLNLPNPVVALENGTMGWELAGLDLERGARRWAAPAGERSRARAAAIAARIAAEDGIRLTTPAELHGLWERRGDQDVCLLDVRTAEEYADGHLPGAVWAPGGQAVQATDDYVAVRAASIVLVCDGGARSVMTAAWLGRMGFPNVSVLAGGVPAWRAAGGAVEAGPRAPLPFGWDAARQAVPSISPVELAARRTPDGPLLLGVDQSDVHRGGHVPGARWICRSRLELRMAALVPDRREPIVVTCADGRHSTLAAATLVDLGYAAVAVLAGGTRAWEAAGLPVERGLARPLDEPDDVVPKPYERGRDAMERYLRWEEALDAEGRSAHALRPPERKIPNGG